MIKFSTVPCYCLAFDKKTKMGFHYLLQKSFMFPLLTPRLVAGGIFTIVLFLHLVNRSKYTQINSFSDILFKYQWKNVINYVITLLYSQKISSDSKSDSNLTNYFKHQSDEARAAILQKSCLDIMSEENISNLNNRIHDLEPVPSETVDHLTDAIVDVLNITRKYTIEILRNTLSCRTIDVDNLSVVLKVS